MTEHDDLTARLRDPWGTAEPGELVDIYDLAERAADVIDSLTRERDELAATVERLWDALSNVMAGGCGPDCASSCRHVNAKDCTGCEAIVAAVRAALADTEEATDE